MERDTLFDQLTTMNKAYGYDVLAKDNKALKEENKKLTDLLHCYADRVKYLEDLIKEYTTKMLNNLK